VNIPIPQTIYVSDAKAYMYQPASSFWLVGRASWPEYAGTCSLLGTSPPPSSPSLWRELISASEVYESSSSASKADVAKDL
jgi:hypothetical protein